jgi:hypothetical protein
MDKDDKIFGNKTLSDIFSDIYKKSNEKDRQIKMLIGELRPLIQNIGDATVIVPLIKEYMEVAVRNDDHLIKMAGIVQRLIGSQQKSAALGGDNFMLSEDEKAQLLSELDNIEADIQDANEEQDDIQSKIDDVKNKLNPPEEPEEGNE